MATDTVLTHHTSTSDEPAEDKVDDEKIEAPAAEVLKNDSAPATDVTVEDKIGVEKDSPPEAVKSTPEKQPTMESAEEEAGEQILQKIQDQPKMVDIPEPSKEIEKPDSAVPEVEGKVEVEKIDSVVPPEVEEKLEGQSEVTEKLESMSKEVEKVDSIVPEADVKLEGQSKQVPEKVETVSTELEKPDSVVAEVKAELGGQSEVIEKVETVSTEVEKSASELPETEVKPEAPSEVTEQVKYEEVEPKENIQGGNVKDEETLADKVEETVQPMKVEGASSRDAEASEKMFPGESTGKDVEAVEDKNEEIAKDEKPAIVERNKDEQIEEKQEDSKLAINEPVKELPESELEVKDRESLNTGDTKLELSTKDGDDIKPSKEVPAKHTQKQSNNIISKVKQSLVKAKKAIIGKSPSSKTLSPQTKGDVKVI